MRILDGYFIGTTPGHSDEFLKVSVLHTEICADNLKVKTMRYSWEGIQGRNLYIFSSCYHGSSLKEAWMNFTTKFLIPKVEKLQIAAFSALCQEMMN